MSVPAKELRKIALEMMVEIGNPAHRTNKGQQWLVKIADGKTALLKTAGKGGLLVTTRSSDNDAEIIGFDVKVSHVMAIVCNLDQPNDVSLYLIPKNTVEEAYRQNYKEWQEHKSGRASTTWVLKFNKTHASYYGHNMAEEWEKYLVCEKPLHTVTNALSHPPASKIQTASAVLDRAKKDIADAYGVPPHKVRISVDF